MPRSRYTLLALLLLFGLCILALRATAIQLEDVTWETFGDNVQFTVVFENIEPVPSEPIAGQIDAQPFGAFVDSVSLVCDFEAPSVPPGDTYTVICTVPLGELPDVPEQVIPDGTYGSGSSSFLPPPAETDRVRLQTGCAPSDYWSGGLGVTWTGDGGGEEDFYRAALPVCSGVVPSYIQVLMDCPSSEQVSWSFSGLCPGWSATLVNEQFEAAPNPLPAGSWIGWIRVDAIGLPIGEVCTFTMDTLCGSFPEESVVTVETCDCEPLVPVESSTWGRIKHLHSN
ncbi:MAG: hypothetical protein PVF43_05740 [Candidatus Eiseniibacteriota bacterium]|jgi:hypothetical protein